MNTTLGYTIGEIGYGNGLLGGVGAVVGEVIGSEAYDRGYSKESALKIASISGALSGLITGGTAESVGAGSRTSQNAAENNAYLNYRPLDFKNAPKPTPGGLGDDSNLELHHEAIKYDNIKDGRPNNVGYYGEDGNKVTVGAGADNPYLMNKYQPLPNGQSYNDNLMEQAVNNVTQQRYSPDDYSFILNNCQDFTDSVRIEYNNLFHQNGLDFGQ